MTPEEEARQEIDQRLEAAGWQIQDYRDLNLGAALGVAVREFPLTTGSVDYLLVTDLRDPVYNARRIFAFHRPDTLQKWLTQDKTLRARLKDLPSLSRGNLRECQLEAITNLEESCNLLTKSTNPDSC